MKAGLGLAVAAMILLGGCAPGSGDVPPSGDRGPAVETDGAAVRITVSGRPVLEYAMEERLPSDTLPGYYRRSGYIDSVYSPEGHLLTDAFPAGHTHHHGIFTAWTSATFRGEHLDFWNQHHETGTARHAELLEIYDSAGVAGFRVRLEQVSLQYGPILSEDWRVRVYDTAEPYVWDLRTAQTNVTGDTLYLNRYDYGGLGVRGSADWNQVDSLRFRAPAKFLTSAGDFRAAANHTRPEWVAMYGETSGIRSEGTAGLAVFPHPENFRAPEFVRVHPDMPYLSVTPVVEEGFSLPPGETFVARYRFVLFDGEPAGIDLSRYGWSAFPPR
ncbi:PmoA family protein [Lewinella sp. IMCC34183]|uniref:DUF6807 domain-containing protein n=1 Tax=Lewinella sp. IMCC34183 TaxID=2248762 RepID=UPI000E2309A8|nr:PmoA family protein [Lewinella sp. IMCC34183]